MLRVEGLQKTYVTDQGQVPAVRGVSFEVARGEIFTLLGSSGCGKSTTLRCVAGLEVADDGLIELGGVVVFNARERVNVPTNQRDLGMVFQSYAIWPHMTVFENVAFPLRYGPYRIARQELRERVMQALRLVQMEAMAERGAPVLSGGRRRRVAPARAVVSEPSVLWLDEPLSNLDARLRLEMRTELQALIRQLHITALYVTHDQEEALALSDRIAVMQDGHIMQEGPPREIYSEPATPGVAAFVGRTNFFAAVVEDAPPGGPILAACDFGRVACAPGAATERPAPGEAVWLTIRPEDVVVHDTPRGEASNAFAATVTRVMFGGSRSQYELQLVGHTCQAETEGRSRLAVGTGV